MKQQKHGNFDVYRRTHDVKNVPDIDNTILDEPDPKFPPTPVMSGLEGSIWL